MSENVKISPSQIGLYLRCRLAWHRKYVLGDRRQSEGRALTIGKDFASLLEHNGDVPLAHPVAKAIAAHAPSHWRKPGTRREVELTSPFRRKGRRSVYGAELYGFADEVDGDLLIEYKTGRSPDVNVAAAQVALYSMALGLKKAVVRMVDVPQNKTDEASVAAAADPKRYREVSLVPDVELAYQLAEVAHEIRWGKPAIVPNYGMNCRFCDYKTDCYPEEKEGTDE